MREHPHLFIDPAAIILADLARQDQFFLGVAVPPDRVRSQAADLLMPDSLALGRVQQVLPVLLAGVAFLAGMRRMMSAAIPKPCTCFVGPSKPQSIRPVAASTRHTPFFWRWFHLDVEDLQAGPVWIDVRPSTRPGAMRRVAHRVGPQAFPLSSSTAEPSTSSSRPSLSTSAARVPCEPVPIVLVLARESHRQLMLQVRVVGLDLDHVVGAALHDQRRAFPVEIRDGQHVAAPVVLAGETLAVRPRHFPQSPCRSVRRS